MQIIYVRKIGLIQPKVITLEGGVNRVMVFFFANLNYMNVINKKAIQLDYGYIPPSWTFNSKHPFQTSRNTSLLNNPSSDTSY